MCGWKCTDLVGCEELYKTLNVKFIVSFLIECCLPNKDFSVEVGYSIRTDEVFLIIYIPVCNLLYIPWTQNLVRVTFGCGICHKKYTMYRSVQCNLYQPIGVPLSQYNFSQMKGTVLSQAGAGMDVYNKDDFCFQQSH